MDKTISVICALLGFCFFLSFLSCGLMALLILALSFVGVAAIPGGLIMADMVSDIYYRHRERGLDIERKDYENRAFRMQNSRGHHSSQHGFFTWTEDGEVKQWTRGRASKAAESNNTDENPAVINVIEVIENALFCALIAPQDTGKTTLLRHLVSRTTGQTILIDPHSENSEAIGYGRNYSQINEVLLNLMAELDTRYNSGHFNHKRLNVFIDELTLLKKNCPAFSEFMPIMLTESRKIGMRIVACVHSKRAKVLGLEGSYDLSDGITICSLKYNKRTGQRTALIEENGECYPAFIPHLPTIENDCTGQKMDFNKQPHCDPQGHDEKDEYQDAEYEDAQAPANVPRLPTKPVGLTEREQEIYDILYEHLSPLTAADIEKKTDMKLGNIRKVLSNMKKNGHVVNVARGYYSPTI